MEAYMTHTFINFTNHPSSLWDEAQKQAAEAFGNILDIPFPAVTPNLSEKEIMELGDTFIKTILSHNPAAVLCQGEFTLAFYVTSQLKKQGIPVLAACSERDTVIVGNEKRSIFKFVQFREYV